MSKKWHDRYMDLAREVARWSKDPSTNCGAIFVGEDGQVLSQGYNGFPRQMRDDEELYNNRETKYERVVHAEMNGVFNASRTGVSLKDSTCYVYGLSCCHECAKALIQVGVKRVVMNKSFENPRWSKSCTLATTFFEESSIEVVYI
jgi:dCMP deaminase